MNPRSRSGARDRLTCVMDLAACATMRVCKTGNHPQDLGAIEADRHKLNRNLMDFQSQSTLPSPRKERTGERPWPAHGKIPFSSIMRVPSVTGGARGRERRPCERVYLTIDLKLPAAARVRFSACASRSTIAMKLPGRSAAPARIDHGAIFQHARLFDLGSSATRKTAVVNSMVIDHRKEFFLGGRQRTERRVKHLMIDRRTVKLSGAQI
jgi:hypothetical protein